MSPRKSSAISNLGDQQKASASPMKKEGEIKVYDRK